ncbi:OadG family protein [Fusobacterium polymorphum]|uniref:OadG family protein n=1 Tax=Fusobacterium nucleatum subsp. polymorphum TaxID=76857 RepID=UPI003008F8CA
MWTSDTMTFGESLVTFLIGFSIVFFALIALALFIIISSKVINLLVKEEVPEQKPVASNVNASANTAAKVVVKEDNQEEVERLAVIISAISEEMREPVENFNIVSITEI